jgi:hypothetical protein
VNNNYEAGLQRGVIRIMPAYSNVSVYETNINKRREQKEAEKEAYRKTAGGLLRDTRRKAAALCA